MNVLIHLVPEEAELSLSEMDELRQGVQDAMEGTGMRVAIDVVFIGNMALSN